MEYRNFGIVHHYI